MSGGALEEVVEGLRADLERERAARQKQDDALRLLWNEVSSLRTSQKTKAAVLIQKLWRGHDDRALYSVALAHFRAYKHARETATRKLQRAARRWFSKVFGAMFRCRWRACVHVQVRRKCWGFWLNSYLPVGACASNGLPQLTCGI